MLSPKQLNTAVELAGKADSDQLRTIFLAAANQLLPPKPIPTENTRGFTCPDCSRWRLYSEGCDCFKQLTK